MHNQKGVPDSRPILPPPPQPNAFPNAQPNALQSPQGHPSQVHFDRENDGIDRYKTT